MSKLLLYSSGITLFLISFRGHHIGNRIHADSQIPFNESAMGDEELDAELVTIFICSHGANSTGVCFHFGNFVLENGMGFGLSFAGKNLETAGTGLLPSA